MAWLNLPLQTTVRKCRTHRSPGRRDDRWEPRWPALTPPTPPGWF